MPDMDSTITDEMIEVDSILSYFTFAHLPNHLQTISRPFNVIAAEMFAKLERGPERTVCFRKLLEAKDCAVRAAL